jgi:hypothetical protein
MIKPNTTTVVAVEQTAPPASTPSVNEIWQEIWDHEYQAYFYFNSDTNETSWTAPEGWIPIQPDSDTGEVRAAQSLWQEIWDDEFSAYYYWNTATGDAVWTKPDDLQAPSDALEANALSNASSASSVCTWCCSS